MVIIQLRKISDSGSLERIPNTIRLMRKQFNIKYTTIYENTMVFNRK
jgi:hypothetical protein